MSYTIGSFNLCRLDFSKGSKAFKQIAKIIKGEHFDVVAMQELIASGENPNTLVNNQLMMALGNDWGIAVSSSDNPRFDNYSEGYGFIWNKKRLDIADHSTPRITNMNLVRPPMCCCFIPSKGSGGPYFELRLINTHIAFGAPNDEPMSDLEYRRHEFETLTEEIYPNLSTPKETTRDTYTILMGDYNLCIIGSDKIRPENEKINDGIVETPLSIRRDMRTMQHHRSTVKQPSDEIDDEKKANTLSDAYKELKSATRLIKGSTDYYSKDYDHFSMDVPTCDKIEATVTRVDALRKYYPLSTDPLKEYRKEVSDHVPIKMEIRFK